MSGDRVIQTAVVEGFHPLTNPNGSHARRHWSLIRKYHHIDAATAWATAMQAHWQPVRGGKVRLSITLVYARKVRVDTDNLVARCKGLIDGLKPFFVDDDTEHLELVVGVDKGPKATRLEMEALPGSVVMLI